MTQPVIESELESSCPLAVAAASGGHFGRHIPRALEEEQRVRLGVGILERTWRMPRIDISQHAFGRSTKRIRWSADLIH